MLLLSSKQSSPCGLKWGVALPKPLDFYNKNSFFDRFIFLNMISNTIDKHS